MATKRPTKAKPKGTGTIRSAVGPSMGESRTVRIRKIENGYLVSTEEYRRGKYTSKDVYTPDAPKLDVPTGRK